MIRRFTGQIVESTSADGREVVAHKIVLEESVEETPKAEAAVVTPEPAKSEEN
jgi:hypothetical protein